MLPHRATTPRTARATRGARRVGGLLVAALAAALLPVVAPGTASAATAPPTAADHRWSPVPIGGGGWVTGLVTGPTGEVYARSDVGGAYRWDEGTRRWTQLVTAGNVPAPDPTADYRVESIAVAPSDGRVVYLAVGNSLKARTGRILRSDDAGRTWREGGRRFFVHGNEEWRWGGERLAVDPADPDTVMFGSRKEGVWLSHDGGATWAQAPVPFVDTTSDYPQPGVGSTLFQPGSGTTAAGRTRTLWAGSNNRGVYRSDDAGATWRLVHPVTGVPRDLELGPDDSLYVAVHGTRSEVVRIDTATSSVTPITPPTTGKIASVAVDPHRPGRVLVAENGVKDGHLWRSLDRGATWTRLNVSIAATEGAARWPTSTDIDGWMSTGELTFDPARPGLLWFGEGMGVWRTTDLDSERNVRWEFASDGIEELVSNDAVKPPGGALLTAHWDRAVVRHPGDGPATLPLTGRFNAAWDLDVVDRDPDFVVAVVDDQRFCCAADGSAWQSGYSTDGGRTWERFESLRTGTHPDGLAFGNIAVSSGSRDVIVWAPSRGGKVHHTTDRGRTWHRSAYPGSEPHFAHYLNRRTLVADPVRSGTFYVLDTKGLMRSTDGGATWTATAGKGLPPSWARRYNAVMTAVPGRAGDLLLTVGPLDGSSFGLLRSTDGGDTWRELPGMRDAGAIDVGPPTVAGGPPAIFAAGTVAGASGLWRSDDDGASWALVSAAPLGIYQGIKVVTADPDVPGRVYVGFSGNGFAVGDPSPGGGPVPPTTAPPTTAPPTSAPPTATPPPTSSPVARSLDASCPAGRVRSSGFGDTGGNVHARAIDCLAHWTVTQGLTADRYGPSNAVTRGQMATFLARALEQAGHVLPASPPSRFRDVRGTTHARAVDQLAALGIVAGRADGTFGHGASVSREQMATFIVRTVEARTGTTLTGGRDWFADDDGSVHATSIDKAATAGLATGRSERTFDPRGAVRRDQMASFLARTLALLTEAGFASVP